MGKPELKLMFQNGALSVLNDPDLDWVDNDLKERIKQRIEANFEEQYKALAPLFALISNSV